MKDLTFTIEEKKVDGAYSQFEISPLEAGFGHTLGTSLRRVLLTALPGAAVTDVVFNGANHQFTTLPGVKEDLVEVVLNLKKVRFSVKSGESFESVKVVLEKIGPGEVRAGDLEVPAQIEVANKDLVIASLSDKKSRLKAQITVSFGVGYSPSEERPSDVLGVIVTDALFSPIKKVNIAVDDVRVGRETNYDKLILDVWTDGTIPAKMALSQSAKILASYFKQVYQPNNHPEEEGEKKTKEPAAMKESVAETKLPTRTVNALEKAGYKTIADLAKAGPKELAQVKNLGKKSVELVEKVLNKKGVGWS
ncbi:MAG: DNA-directed RNA polymerase subunit alpha [Candidatus Shapirobacteria bacterium]|nr:DNA-directed RNA polymerase subunit alpha [Candidatus Shapirobacteria bacterium]MDD5073907.1 DNA-directed RNA polymerase subunit alpha [Candidatus Shapirobacteria bacterium]MDD5481577.1 DNA-directed RNA polymerase subunit alpha [Candidatus Shapirobacteria bacterium]